MANKRDNTSQKRQRENRARRQALEARTKGAPARPSRVAPKTVEKLANKPAESAPAGKNVPPAIDDKAAKGSGRAAKPRRERPPKPGDRPVDVTTLEGGWVSRHMQVPGGTQVLAAGAMAVVATGLMSFTKVFFAAHADKKAKPTQTVFEHFHGAAIPVLLVPLAITFIALFSTFRPQRRRIWFTAAILLGLAASNIMQYYLFVAGFLAYGVYRAYKVEGPQESIVQVIRRRIGRGPADPDDDPESSESVDEVDDPADEFDEVEVQDEVEEAVDSADADEVDEPVAPSRPARGPRRRINGR